MPSWDEIRDHARSKYILQDDNDTWFSLVWNLGDNRSHKVVVRKFQAYDEEWVEFRAMICKANEMSPKIALRKNAELIIGAIATDNDGDFVIIHNASLVTMDMPEFERPLISIARVADEMEKTYSEGNDDW